MDVIEVVEVVWFIGVFAYMYYLWKLYNTEEWQAYMKWREENGREGLI